MSATQRTRSPIPSEHTGTRHGQAIQENAARAVRSLNALPFANGKATELLTFTAGETKSLNHGLGRVPSGFIVLAAFGNAPALYATAVPDASTASIKSDLAGVYRLWFF